MASLANDNQRLVEIKDRRVPQQKSVLHRLGGWFKRRFGAKKREQVVERNVEKERNEQNVVSRKVMESGPLWQNTSAEVWGRESCADSDGEADTTEPIHSDITSSMKSTTRLAGEGVLEKEVGKVLGSDGIYPNKVIVRTEYVDEASERTTALLTHRSLTKGNKLAELNGIESSAPVMAGCVDTLHVDSRGSGRWVSARRSDRVAVPVRAERDQSTRGRRSSQGFRRDSQKSNEENSTPNGGNEVKGSLSDVNRLDVELASVVRVEVSDDDIRAVAEDSIVPTEGQKIEDFKTRERKLKALLKKKEFHKVKIDGDQRYVKKAIERTSLCSVVKRLFCLEGEEQNQIRDAPNLRIEAQVGREDLINEKVNKSIGDQNVGRKRKIIPVLSDPPLRDVKSPQSESNRLRPKKEWTPKKWAQYEALKESFRTMLYENQKTRNARIDGSVFESEPKQTEPVNMILESELAQIRQIDQSEFESVTKRSEPTYQVKEWNTLASEVFDIVSDSECSSVRHLGVSALKSEQQKEPAHEKKREISLPEALDMILESELAQIRGKDKSVLATQPKPGDRERTKESRISISEAVKPVLPLLKDEGIILHRCIGIGGQACVFRADYQRYTESQELAVKVCLSKKHDLSRELKHMRRVTRM